MLNVGAPITKVTGWSTATMVQMATRYEHCTLNSRRGGVFLSLTEEQDRTPKAKHRSRKGRLLFVHYFNSAVSSPLYAIRLDQPCLSACIQAEHLVSIPQLSTSRGFPQTLQTNRFSFASESCLTWCANSCCHFCISITLACPMVLP
jgi:hypothetical protein